MPKPEQLHVRCHENDMAIWRKAASAAGFDELSEWVRRCLNDAARVQLGEIMIPKRPAGQKKNQRPR